MSKPRPSELSRRASTSDLALFFATAEVPDPPAGRYPEWIKIAPAGELRCRDGRKFTLDPGVLVRRFDEDGVEVPVDLDHAVAHKASRGFEAPAQGWIDRLEERPNGLWGRVREWLAAGKAVLDARTHRYVSPAFSHDREGRATWLHSVALVAAPALAMPALLSAGRASEAELLGELAAALGLDEFADRAACLSAVTDLATGAVPLAVHDATVAQLSATTARLRTVEADRRREKVDALIDGAMKALKIAPAEREEYVALCSTEVGFATVERLFAAKAPIFGPSSLEGRRTPEPGGRGDRNPAQLAADVREFMREREGKGHPAIGFADAMTLYLANGS